jgi:YVTN family beta-propeller protein
VSTRSLALVAFGALVGAVTLGGCDSSGTIVPLGGESDHSSSIAVTRDGSTVYVVNPDADSVSFVDTASRQLVTEVLLAPSSPSVEATGRYEPRVGPRALALGPGERTLYVTGERSGHLYAVDTASAAVVADVDACSEPIGVVASPDGSTVYVACSQDDAVIAFDAATLAVTEEAPCSRRPWTLAWSSDRSQLLVTHLLGPGVTAFAPSPLAVSGVWALADGQKRVAEPTTPHGQVRGIYDVLARPGSDERWALAMMLGTDTPQPTLAFDSTAFSMISILDDGGDELARLTVSTDPGDGGAFGDVVSGPHAIGFSPDGRLAFVADTASEDVLVVDAVNRVEAALVRPLPGHQPEGIAVSSDGHVYVDERNTSEVAVLDVSAGGAAPVVTVDGPAIPRTAHDPMPPDLRLGQHVFFSANSDELPVTTDHWVSCATCHLEGRSDAVTWLFSQGPRDTPSNAGGMLATGFLFRTAARSRVQDYWQTIDVEQGGHFSTSVPLLAADLDALEHFVDRALPYATAPRGLDPAAVARGAALFASVGCGGCHSGPAFTDSGAGNPSLDLAGTVLLHDVGTCVTAGYADQAFPDEDGDPRAACAFDTPTLRGIADSAPYLHDGSAATLDDVFRLAPGMVGEAASQLSDDDRAALVTYLKSL